MKVLVPEVATHVMENGEGKNQEILSVDSHPSLPIFVSAGAGENRLIFWKLNFEADMTAEPSTTTTTTTSSQPTWMTFLCEMTAMSFDNTVNILRFSPCGRYLACGDSRGIVTILSLKEDCPSWLDLRDEKSLRRVHLRGHTIDVQDFAWSPDSLYCASAAMDNFVLIWDVLKCTEIHRIKDHTHYAQGVAWSADGHLLATSSFDETVRVYRITRKNKKLTCEETNVFKKPRLFADEFRAPTFCRRLAFSPESWSGLLVAPGGLTRDPTFTAKAAAATNANTSTTTVTSEEIEETDKPIEEKSGVEGEEDAKKKRSPPVPLVPATHIFRFSKSGSAEALPVATLSGFELPSLAVRFHPRAFRPIADSQECYLSFSATEEKRLLFATASIDSLLVYDTQHPHPIAYMQKLHYASYTDMAWSVQKSCSILIAASRDGCFSMVKFDHDEIGEMLEEPSVQVPSETESPKLDDDPANSKLSETASEMILEVETEQVQPNAPESTAKSESEPHVIAINENSRASANSTSGSAKKRRVMPENIAGPHSNSSPVASSPDEKPTGMPIVNTLQPRRVRLDNIQPL